MHEIKAEDFANMPKSTKKQFRKGSTKIYWKNSFDDVAFQEGVFLQKYIDTYTLNSNSNKHHVAWNQHNSEIL